MSESNVTISVVENTIDVLDGQNTVVVSQIENTINVSAPGPQGPAGDTGPAGATGAPGANGREHATYVFQQQVSSNTWTVNHNLDAFPAVQVVDSAGNEVVGDVDYTSANQLVLTFTSAFAGVAYLN